MKSKIALIALLGLAMSAMTGLAADAPQQQGLLAGQGAQAPAGPARPGTINYIEGAAYLDGQPLNNKEAGNAILDAGQELNTANGKVEVLLTPGVFLRLDSNSAVKMVNPGLALTQVELEKGRASVEVDEIYDQNDLQIVDAGVTTRLDKKGYYEFDANHPEAMVFKGMAKSEVADGKWREIKGDHELALTGGPKEKPAEFDPHAQDELYNWSSLRSQYLAEANNEIAGEYAGAPGWYWDPYMWDYTFIGGGPFYSPFGWGFYPLGWGGWYGQPYWGRYPYRYGAYGYHGYHPGFARGGVYGGGFHGGVAGGFHGGAGGGHR